MHCDVAERDVRDFQETWSLPLLRVGGEVSDGLGDVALLLNCLAEQLWHQDRVTAGSARHPSHQEPGTLLWFRMDPGCLPLRDCAQQLVWEDLSSLRTRWRHYRWMLMLKGLSFSWCVSRLYVDIMIQDQILSGTDHILYVIKLEYHHCSVFKIHIQYLLVVLLKEINTKCLLFSHVDFTLFVWSPSSAVQSNIRHLLFLTRLYILNNIRHQSIINTIKALRQNVHLGLC